MRLYSFPPTRPTNLFCSPPLVALGVGRRFAERKVLNYYKYANARVSGAGRTPEGRWGVGGAGAQLGSPRCVAS